MYPVEPAREPGTKRVIYGSKQPQYLELVTRQHTDGTVISEWQPTAEDLAAILAGARIRVSQLTFGQPLQPVKVEVG